VAFGASDATERIVHHPAMDMPGAQLLGFRIGGLTLHAWDLARASGGDETPRLGAGRGRLGATIAYGGLHVALCRGCRLQRPRATS